VEHTVQLAALLILEEVIQALGSLFLQHGPQLRVGAFRSAPTSVSLRFLWISPSRSRILPSSPFEKCFFDICDLSQKLPTRLGVAPLVTEHKSSTSRVAQAPSTKDAYSFSDGSKTTSRPAAESIAKTFFGARLVAPGLTISSNSLGNQEHAVVSNCLTRGRNRFPP